MYKLFRPLCDLASKICPLPAVSIESLDTELKRMMHKEAVEAYFKALRNPEHCWEITKNLKTEYSVPQARPEPDKTQFSIHQ